MAATQSAQPPVPPPQGGAAPQNNGPPPGQTPAAAQPGAILTGPQGQTRNSSLYVGDLGAETTEGDLYEVFNAIGPVASIRVCRDAVTRASLGYAYVNFHDPSDAERALDQLNYSSINRRVCRIMWTCRDPSLRRSGVGNIFVKNLDPSIDHKGLYDTFSLFGNILSCKVATDANGGSRGYAFVHYESEKSANEAIAKVNGMQIQGNVVHVGKFLPRAQRPGRKEWTNVFFKDLPLGWDEDKLRAVFGKYGPITSAKVFKSEARGNKVASGFGFANFEKSDDAKACVEAFPDGCKISEVDPDYEAPAPVDGEPAAPEGIIFVGRAQKRAERERELAKKWQEEKQQRLSKYQGVNLYVKNLGEDATDDDFREMFQTFGEITSARVMRDKDGMSKGFGFVCFTTPEEATKAVTEMSGKIIKKKPLFVALAQRKEVRRAQLMAQHDQQPRMGMPMGGGPGPAGMYMQSAPMFYQGPGAQQMGMQARFMQPHMAMAPRGAMRGLPRGPVQPGFAQVGYYGAGNMHPAMMNPQMMHNGGGRGAGGRGAGGRGNMGRQQPRGGPQAMLPRGPAGPGAPMGAPRGYPQAQQGQMMPGGAPPMPQQMPGAPMPQQQAPPQQDVGGGLTLQALTQATTEEAKNMLGERLYPLIQRSRPEEAGKITGMLLEMDNAELINLIESPNDLTQKIEEAVQVLESTK